ncbi:MAG: helix-turn-helix domain-containing protein [Sphingobium sp.]
MTYTYKLPPLDPCPVEHVVQLIGGKWKARLLGRIRECPASVGDLQRFLPRIRPQVLLRQLKALEQDDLISRLAPASGRDWGRYTLTDRARALLAAVDAIAFWGERDLAEALNRDR